MRYSVMNGGQTGSSAAGLCRLPSAGQRARRSHNGAACAELIHAYSLVHDDLPAMDDDDRAAASRPPAKAFDEACAILAGDGLQSLAFSALLDPQLNTLDADTRLRMVTASARAAGPAGMVGGCRLTPVRSASSSIRRRWKTCTATRPEP